MLERSYKGSKVVRLSQQGTRLTFIRVDKDHVSLLFEGPTIVALIEQRGVRSSTSSAERCALLYGLSKAETRALSGIVDGKSVSRIADEAKLSRETIRTQLKSVYAKIGVRRQADLVRLVHSFER